MMGQQAWTPDSWRNKPTRQIPAHDAPDEFGAVERQLAGFPPLVFAGEVRKLKASLGRVAVGDAFLLQGGDCADSFVEHSAGNIQDFFHVILQMAVVLIWAGASPVVKVGRLAGRSAKPRSAGPERVGDAEWPGCRGDIVDDVAFDDEPHGTDPRRQLEAYRQSAATLNRLRAFATDGYANLDSVHRWMRSHVGGSEQGSRHAGFADQITETLAFMRAIGIDPEHHPETRTTDFFTSHEALLLGYEEALTRVDSTSGQPYATSGHMLWIGDHTRLPDRAHVEFARGIRNPIGVKCGPSLRADDLLRLADILDPARESGRLTLICRFGANQMAEHLPGLIRALVREGRTVAWCCDPMHGQTANFGSDKTRLFELLVKEIEVFFAIHRAEGTHAGGLHLEMTGKDGTRRTGDRVRPIAHADLPDRHHTYDDTRLDADQAIEIAFMTAELIKRERSSRHGHALPPAAARAG